jgi:spore coat polysaccharide biosynthesis protein SpsF
LVKIIGITQARIGSTRLPGKVLMSLLGKTVLEYHLENAIKSKMVDKWIVATTNEIGVDKIVQIANQFQVVCYKGEIDNVLTRFYEAAKPELPDYVIRITSDCPLLDAELVDSLITYAIENNLNYCATSLQYPDGVDVEAFRFSELEEAYNKAILLSDREHVTPYIRRKEVNSQIKNLFPCEGDFEHIRLTVDESKDFEALEILINELGSGLPWKKYVDFIINNLSLFSNQKIVRNEGYLKSLQKEN